MEPGFYSVDGQNLWWDGTQWLQQPPEQKKGFRLGCGGWSVIVLFFGCIIALLVNGGGSGGLSGSDALTYCEKNVKEKLKAPSTAKFHWDQPVATLIQDQAYIVSGTVDAENGFGAMLRSSISCSVSLNGTMIDVTSSIS